jgi:hypothetical protein
VQRRELITASQIGSPLASAGVLACPDRNLSAQIAAKDRRRYRPLGS